MKYYPPHDRTTFAFHRKQPKSLKQVFVVEDEAGIMLLLIVGMLLVGVAFWLGKGEM